MRIEYHYIVSRLPAVSKHVRTCVKFSGVWIESDYSVLYRLRRSLMDGGSHLQLRQMSRSGTVWRKRSAASPRPHYHVKCQPSSSAATRPVLGCLVRSLRQRGYVCRFLRAFEGLVIPASFGSWQTLCSLSLYGRDYKLTLRLLMSYIYRVSQEERT